MSLWASDACVIAWLDAYITNMLSIVTLLSLLILSHGVLTLQLLCVCAIDRSALEVSYISWNSSTHRRLATRPREMFYDRTSTSAAPSNALSHVFHLCKCSDLRTCHFMTKLSKVILVAWWHSRHGVGLDQKIRGLTPCGHCCALTSCKSFRGVESRVAWSRSLPFTPTPGTHYSFIVHWA